MPFAVIFPIIAPMQAQLITKAGKYEGTRSVTIEKSIGADDLLNKPAFVDFSKGKVFLCEFCNTEVDRHSDRFTIPVLQKFADNTNRPNGVPMLYGHDRDNPIGRAFGAYLEGTKLMGYAYVLNSMVMPKQPSVSIADAIEGKILTDVSVGFRGHIRSAEQDANSNTTVWEWFIPTTGADVTELSELSAVTIGAQIGAGFKALDADNKKQQQNLNMSHTKSISAGGNSYEIKAVINGENVSLDTTAIEQGIKALETAKAESDGKLKTATDENTALKAQVAEMREPLETQVLNHEQTKGAAGLTEAQVKAMPFAQLSAKAAEAEKATGSDNGKTKSDQDSTKKLDY